MASVTQKIGNYVLGISTQPDEKKLPGQVTDLVNGVPDVVRQLIKRPGSNLVTSITPSTAAHTKWFNIYTTSSEQYIGQAGADGAVKIWRCNDGVEIPVDYANIPGTNKATYLDNTALLDEKSSDIQVSTVNESTFFINRRKTVAMKTGKSDLSPAKIYEAYIELDTIAYGKQYSLDIYDPDDNTEYVHTRATAIVVDETTSYSGSSNGDCKGMGRETVNVNSINTASPAIYATSPPNASSGGKTNLRYEMDTRCTPQPTDDDDNDNYHDAYAPYSKLQFGGEGWKTDDTHQYTSEKGITTTVTITAHGDIYSRANVAMVRPAPTSSNNEEHVSSGGILGGMKSALDAIPGTGITCKIVGNGLHLYRATPFGVTTPEKTLMNIATSEVNNIGDLPRNCRHGYTVRVVNSGEDMDDYYLKFQAEGIASEIAKSGTYTRAASGSISGNYTRGVGHTIATSAVNTSNEQITISGHGMSTGDAIRYDDGGGTALAGLTDNTTYYVIYVSVDVIKLATSVSNAAAGTTINLTGTGNNSQTLTHLPTTITITDAAHGLAHGDQIVAAFSGAATDGTYTIQNVTTDTFDVIDATPGAITSTSMTYTHGLCTVTTAAAHNLTTGDDIIMDFTSGGASDGYYYVTVTGATTFTVNQPVATGIDATPDDTCTYQPYYAGEGVWEEVAAPGIETTFDDDTMPLQLVRVEGSTQYTVATSSVNVSNEQITISNHGMVTGVTVLYNNGGGTTLAGLTNDTIYYVIKASANNIALASSADNATNGIAVNLTGTGNNAQTFTWGYFDINGGANAHYINGAFRFKYPDWGQRDVGDDITNAPPSFVGDTIQNMTFFRNRIALLSEENVILSRVNDFFNFWVKTAMAISNADPIDLQSSSTYPTKLYSAVEANSGLIILSASEQFLLSSGAEALLTPETAKVSYLSSYAFNSDTNPISLGTTIGFLNSTARDARFYELAGASSREPPVLMEQSKIIGRLFPQNITNITGSTENDLILFSVDSTLYDATNEVWGYKWYEADGKRAQSAWFRWTMPNNVVFHSIMDDVYYVILNTGSTYTLEKFDIKLSADTLMLGDKPDENRVHLDTKKTIATGDLTYLDASDTTTFTLGAGYYSSRTLTAYCIQAGISAGRSYDIPKPAADGLGITGTAPNELVTLPGNWKYDTHEFEHTAVTIATETITVTGHGFATGESVIYKAPTTTGSSAIGGLSNDTTYYVIVVDSNSIKLATNAVNATAGTAINLTNTGSGTHSLQRHMDIVIGYEYEFEVELPKVYMTQSSGDQTRSETRGSLVIHRMNFDFGDVGVIDVTLKRRGRDDYTYTVESLEWDNVSASTATIADGYMHTIPVYDRNVNLAVLIKSNHPSPATVHSMNWEGDYSPRYYSRV